MIAAASTPTDEELLAAYVAGRDAEAAFAALVDRFERRVYAIAYRYFGDHSDAEDAAQEAFITLARKADSFAGDSRLSTWLYRVTVNTCHDIARRRARRPQTPVEDLPEVADEVDAQSARETELEVARALAALDELSRTLVVLITIEGLSYQEAAAIVDLPVGTVKSRVHRARARLADLLADVVEDRGPSGAGHDAPHRAAPASPVAAPRPPPGPRT